jgi:hypothetical protein
VSRADPVHQAVLRRIHSVQEHPVLDADAIEAN